jgi:fatty acid desaturase
MGLEWQTVLLAIVLYSGWVALTWWHDRLPVWMMAPLGGWLIAWHGSLQHETIHGHPSRDSRVNALMGGVPLSLWLPYASYRRSHLAHHRTEAVTDPRQDPESRYLSSTTDLPNRLRHIAEQLQSSLAGRLLLGPPLTIGLFLASELARATREPVAVLRDWIPHGLGVVLVLSWLAACRIGLLEYLLLFVYPGTALSLLRSFAEHRSSSMPGHRVAIVERAGPFGLLFLHNNLHAAHHEKPGLAWYRLPAFHRENRERLLHDNGGLLYQGYQDIARRYLFRRHDDPIHPDYRLDRAPS